VLVRQHPGSAKSIFMTLEDETTAANVMVWPKVFEAHRPIVMGARFVAISGRVQRESGVVHLIAEELQDLTGLLRRLDANEPEAVMPGGHNFHQEKPTTSTVDFYQNTLLAAEKLIQNSHL
jgi:error-prone DNA polymerase